MPFGRIAMLGQGRDRSQAMQMQRDQFHALVRTQEGAVDPRPSAGLHAAVLVELGYLSNTEQEKKLADSEFQSAVAQGMLEAIIRFRDVGAQTEGGGAR